MPKPKAGKSVSPPSRSGGRSPSKSPASKNKTSNTSGAATTKASSATHNAQGSSGPALDDLPPPEGYLMTCDVPTKEYIMYLDSKKDSSGDKKLVIEELDATHLLVREKFKDEILRQVEEWENSNVYSAIEKVGEDFDMS
ncbi:hypothetical protein ACA910_011005 [Epithemia clementina (nom. ined.)]